MKNIYFFKINASKSLIFVLTILALMQTASAQTCTWLGNSRAWDDPNNWSPTLPAINKDAVIPVLNAPYEYPQIDQNVTAQCKSLKLKDNGTGTGAQLKIDAVNNASLTISDSVIIGDDAPVGGSNAAIKVSSINNPTITIPGASSLPPAGLAMVTVTPFRAIAQCKTQVTYTASELATTYGWQSGNIIDKMGILVSGITPAPAGPATFQNFRIQAYLTSTPVTYPFPAPMNTKVAVMFGDANVLPGWPKIIYSNSSLVLNMPNATGGTIANGNYQTFNLIPNTLIWDGMSNLVLSFEYNTVSGTAPLKNYIMYDEPSPSFATLSLNYNIIGTIITGYNLTGVGSYAGGNNAGITGSVSNQRPRIDFTLSKIYQPIHIYVNGNWINNNTSGNGFLAGNSIVTFNGAADAIIGGQPTAFNKVVLNKSLNTKKVTLYNNITIDSALSLTKGRLLLNHNMLTVNNNASNAISRTNGFIISESQNSPYGYINWNVGADYTQHVFPFANNTGTYIPFAYKQSAGDAGFVKASTYKTNLNNLPYPTGVNNVNDTNGTNNKAYTVDRFWTVTRTGTTGNAQLKFSFRNTEAPLPITAGNLEANCYSFATNLWQRFTNSQTNNTGATVSNVIINNVAAANLINGVWALSDKSNPLRIPSALQLEAEIYPNPFNDFVKVNFDVIENTAIDYVIYDTMLREVSKGKLNQGESVINTQQFLPGTYLVKLTGDKISSQVKIVKM